MKLTKEGDNLEVSITVPLTISGPETYGEGEWTADGVVVVINEKMHEFALYHTQFLDYKGALQATAPIAHFDSKEEALKAAEEFDLSIEYHGGSDE